MSLYLWLNIATFGTIFLSFDKKVAYYKYFLSLLKSIVIVMIVFIPWDSYFTHQKIWGFNTSYIIGYKLVKLPLEEWLFFLTVPFSCTFIHFVVKAYFKNPISLKSSKLFWTIFSIIVFAIGVINIHQLYTSIAFVACSLSLFIINTLQPEFMKQFIVTYAVALIPFFIVNSILTGSFTESPIVWYNNVHTFGIRIGTIPVEDLIYNMLLILLSTFFTNLFYTKKINFR